LIFGEKKTGVISGKETTIILQVGFSENKETP